MMHLHYLCTATPAAVRRGRARAGPEQIEQANRLNAKNKHIKVKLRCSITSISFYKIQADFSDTEGCGEGKMWRSVFISTFLGLH